MDATEEREKIIWETENNPEAVSLYDPVFGCRIEIATAILIEPNAYSSSEENHRRRELAIEKGVFTPYSETD